ncbi:hypothetical protein ES705_47526 [subsurface metagenome]
MTRTLPMIRCPCCGKLSLLRNFVGFHKVEAFVLKITGLGRGKGFKNAYEKQIPQGDFIAYWIKRLKEVITYLENLKQQRTMSLISEMQPRNVILSAKVGNLVSTVSENSVSLKTVLKSSYQEKLIESVQSKSQISLPVEKVGLILESKVKPK